MRTYSFDHFKAEKPDPSKTNQGGANPSPPVEHTKPQVPPSEEGEVHYGRQHAQTAELYRKHREERERAERLRVSGARTEPMGDEAAPPAQQTAEPLRQDTRDVEQPPSVQIEEAGLEGLKGLAQQAVSSVLEAAKEAARGRPLTGVRKLAGEAFSGARRVAREVSARRSEPKKGTKGPGKRH